MERAREKVDQILATQEGPRMDPDIEKQFDTYWETVKTRTMEDYRKLEGMDDATETGVSYGNQP